MSEKVLRKKKEIVIPNNNVKLLIILAAICVFLFTMYYLRGVMLPFFIAIILAYVLNPLVSYFERKGIRRTLGVIFIFSILFTVTIIALNMFIDFAGNEVLLIQKNLPKLSEKLRSLSNSFSGYISGVLPGFSKEEFNGTVLKNTVKVSENIGGYIAAYFTVLVISIGWLVSRALNLLVIAFVLFFLLKDWEKIKAAFFKVIVVKYRIPVSKLLVSINQQVSNYIRGQIIVASIVGALSVGGLYLLGFEYAFMLGTVVGITNLIPVMGPLIGVCAGLILSGFTAQSFLISALKVIIVFGAVHILDNTVISPLILSNKVKIHPISVVLSLSLGWYFLGILGMLIAIPFYTTMKLVLKEMYKYYI